MKFTKATIVINRSGTDKVSILTDAPYPYTFDPHHQSLSMDFDATGGTGSTFVQRHFPGLPIEVIDAKTGIITNIPEKS